MRRKIKDKTLKPSPLLPDAIKTVETSRKAISISSISITKFLAVFYDGSVRGIYIYSFIAALKCTHENGIWEKMRKYGTLNGVIKSLRFCEMKIVLSTSGNARKLTGLSC
jgi:hypothetical protein